MCENDNDEELVIHSKCDNVEIMISEEAHQVIKKLFDYQNNLESMRGSNLS